ncbi:hypothetical protein Pmani_025471 [Petrolisthes manimaculis]|uniref:PiggyBac transposable element-derived protein domain-containing protein n=1 Tax=Petrolisthes manimaculis TaxID=1843537 RepID=A0AAE1U157_9EUCA|nr:hypothetical protein Pmani_025471 [Petrolisthes manimaculis]
MSRHHHKDRLTLNEIHDLLDDIDQETVRVAINPPHEEPDANTDCDSDASDDEVTCNPDHLPRRILSAEVNSIANEEPLEENEDTNHDLESPSTSAEPTKKHEWIEELCEQSKLYASQKSLPSDHVTPEKLKVFITVLVISGYNKLPSRRLYWSESPDVFNQRISESIRRDAFEQIMRCLHFADNMKMTDDKFHKVRPLIQHLNQVNKPKYSQEFYSIDEVIIPYYGRHSSKQFIKGKPIRFGFKVWAACTADGFLLHAEPYCGLYTNISDTGLGQGPNVVMEMVKKINLEAGQHVVFDNLFTSVPLLEKLGDQGIGATGTLREDRLSGAPVMAKKVMEKKTRGYLEEAFTGCISVVKWKDNKVVAVGSNKERKTPVNKTKRWCKREKKHVEIDMPHSVKVYNQNMGGVDIFDQQVSAYRIRIRSKKWWWPIFAWSVNAQVTNAWQLYRKLGNNISLLDFLRHFAIAIMKGFGKVMV